MTVYENGSVMRDNRPMVSELLDNDSKDLFDLDLYVKALTGQVATLGGPAVRSYKGEASLAEYVEFLRLLSKTFTGCSFAMPYRGIESHDRIAYKLCKAYSHKNINQLRRQRIFLYVPSNRYTSGWVGLADFRMHAYHYDDYKPKIGVWSAHISNYNTDNSNMQHSLKTTTTASRALTLAKTYFREEAMEKVALQFARDVRGAIVDDRSAVEKVVATAKTKFINHEAFPAAIEWLVDSNYEFSDKGLEEEMRKYVTELKYKTEVLPSQKYPNLIYVRGYLKNGEQMFDQVRLKYLADYSDFFTDHIFGPCTEKDLSEETKRKLSVLMMGEDGSFVAEVGYKHDGAIYYVFE